MAIKIKNISTGEVVNVLNVVVENGTIVSEARRPNKGTRFYNSYPMVLPLGKTEDGRDTHCLRDGWVLDTSRKPRTPRTAKLSEPTPTSEPEPIVNEPAPTIEPTTEPITEPTSEPEPTPAPTPKKSAKVATATNSNNEDLEMAMQLMAMMKGLRQPQQVTAQVDETQVRNIVKEEVAKQEPRIIKVVTPTTTNIINGAVCEKFNVFCNLVNAGKPLYMYGPAGCGKSYTAKQIADSLGKDYYETSQACFAHELKGYGDAKGEFVETAFYRAFAKGGIFFLDEVDASAPEALVVLNNAIANKRFDFPVIGNVTAHEDFRVIAAGNTRMTGATLAYTARQMQDTSFKNRFFFALVGYDESIEIQIAGGDREIVQFAHDLRKAARTTQILQLCSYRQIADLAQLQECCGNDDAYLLRGSVLQEKEIDECNILYTNLEYKQNRWAKAMKAAIEVMKNEEVW